MGRGQGQRDHLLDAGEEFVRFAKQITGVQRISLVGSICTERADPKDIDFVVEISDDVDLESLAAKGRRLKGRAQQGNVGADIFLVRKGRYIGRICHYRECFPRRACHALHCGEIPHLNDDLATLRLRTEVFETPPVTIWPDLQCRVVLPEDVEAFLARFEAPAIYALQPASGATSDTLELNGKALPAHGIGKRDFKIKSYLDKP